MHDLREPVDALYALVLWFVLWPPWSTSSARVAVLHG
jgi:hypothetical protein